MASAEGICCCDLTPHPDDILTYTESKAEGKRYQLISGSCHVMSIELIVHTSAETDSTTAKFFTTPEPAETSEDVNMWNLVAAKGEGSSASTPDQFAGIYFEDGVYVDLMSGDTTVEAIINIVYYRRDTYIPAIPERPNERRDRLWGCYNGEDPYGNNFPDGNEGDDYSDTSSSSTPGTATGEPIGY